MATINEAAIALSEARRLTSGNSRNSLVSRDCEIALWSKQTLQRLLHVATQPNAVLTVSSATCKDVLGVLSHLMRLLSQPLGSEPVSNVYGLKEWLKCVGFDLQGFNFSSGDISLCSEPVHCLSGETVQRAIKELLWYSVLRPFRQHHHEGQRTHLYFNSEKASLLFQGRRCWSPPAA